MATKRTSKPSAAAAGTRRCKGSETFGIEAHEAPVTDFPVQPSRKDGLGTMCKEHWTLYTRSLRQAAQARGDAPKPEPVAIEEPVRVKRARATVAATETLEGTAYTAAIGTDEVQGALATLAGGGGDVAEEAPAA